VHGVAHLWIFQFLAGLAPLFLKLIPVHIHLPAPLVQQAPTVVAAQTFWIVPVLRGLINQALHNVLCCHHD